MMFLRSLVRLGLFFCTLILMSWPAVVSAQLLTGYDRDAFDAPVKSVQGRDSQRDAARTLSSSRALNAPLTVRDPRDEFPEPVFKPSLTRAVLTQQAQAAPTDLSGQNSVQGRSDDGAYRSFLTSYSHEDDMDQPADLEADIMRYDDDLRLVAAKGDVFIVQGRRILRADELEYLVDDDKVRAIGNVVLNEPSGDIYLAQDVEYSDRLQNGNVTDLQSYLSDGSRFLAERGRLEVGQRTIMENATYTACEPCKKDPSRPVPWQITASEVLHEKEDARISYRDAKFKVYGVPIAYAPYFAHADGSIKRKSGFLSPSIGYKSEFGAFVENQYYLDIAPDKDITLGLITMTEEVPLATAQYRQRWRDASLEVNTGLTYSDRTDESNNVEFNRGDEWRGHIFAKGLWDMDERWRSGIDINYVSDEQYPRQYDISNEDVLTSRLYAERFEGRNYATAFAEFYKDVRVGDRETDQPWLMPNLQASFVGEPGAVPVVKGRWDATVNVLSLYRDSSDQDVVRGSVDLGWKRRLVSDYGLVSDIDVTLRGDAYYVNDADATSTVSNQESGSIETRAFPQAHMLLTYPVARNFKTAQVSIEPLVAVTASTKIDANDDIPNEDSQDVQIDTSNLFEANRFPGFDVVEDQSRVTYGMRFGVNGRENSNGELFIGQSYRLDQDNNPFSAGSGLDDQSSDVVGSLRGNYKDRYSAQYRFQLDNESLASERHELDFSADWNRFRLGSTYLYAKPLAGTDITDKREQLFTNAQFYFNKKWRLGAGSRYDLGEDPGLRNASLGLDYFGQCISWSLYGAKDLTDDSSGNNDTVIVFRVGLKNLSEFMRSGLRDEGRAP